MYRHHRVVIASSTITGKPVSVMEAQIRVSADEPMVRWQGTSGEVTCVDHGLWLEVGKKPTKATGYWFLGRIEKTMLAASSPDEVEVSRVDVVDSRE